MKKSRTLKNYIPLVVKQVSDCDITNGAKMQLDKLIYIISELIVKESVNLLNNATNDRHTITIKTLVNTVRTIFSGDLLKFILHNGDNVLQYSTEELKKNVVLPVCYFKSIFRKYNVKVARKCYIYMSGIIDYLLAEIIELSSYQAHYGKHIRITTRDIYIAITSDSELSKLLNTNKILYITCGVKPMYSKSSKTISRDIRHYQSSTKLLLSKHPFSNIVREIIALQDNTDFKISKSTFNLLQHYIETKIVSLLIKANKTCFHCNRTKVTGNDILFTYNLLQS